MLFPPFSECTSRQRAVISSINADRAIKSQKVKSKSRHQPTEREPSLVVSLFLMRDSWERLFLQTSTNAKKKKKKNRRGCLCLVLFRESQIGRRVSEKEDSRGLVISVHPTGNERREEGICSFMARSHIVAARTVRVTEPR